MKIRRKQISSLKLNSTLVKRILKSEKKEKRKKGKKGKYEIYLRNFSREGSENCVISDVSAESKAFLLKQREKALTEITISWVAILLAAGKGWS